MASNEHVESRKRENFVISKEKTSNFPKSCKDFKIVDEILAYKGKRFSSRRDQVVRRRNSPWIRLQIHFKENMEILIKTLTVSICPKIT